MYRTGEFCDDCRVYGADDPEPCDKHRLERK